jgi:hypothetical protein
MGLSIDTIELYERNMIDELADGGVLAADLLVGAQARARGVTGR